MAQPQDVQVTLTPVMNANGSFNYWQMSVDKGSPQGPGNYPAATVTNGNKADFTVTIQNGPGQNFTFANILVPAENKEIHTVSGLGTNKMTFKDHNWGKADIPYEILFTNAPKLDPIIKNDGGGPPVYQAYLLDFAIFAGAVMLTLLFVRLALGWRRV